jgi:hypothetical protein
MGLVQALSEYTFRPAEEPKREILILEPELLEFDAELEEPMDAGPDPMVAVGELFPTWEPEVPLMRLLFAVFKSEGAELIVVLRLVRLKMEVGCKILGQFAFVPTPTL